MLYVYFYTSELIASSIFPWIKNKIDNLNTIQQLKS
jgi:hypothetical protein